MILSDNGWAAYLILNGTVSGAHGYAKLKNVPGISMLARQAGHEWLRSQENKNSLSDDELFFL